MNSYNKLAKLRDETVYQIKKAIEARKYHTMVRNQKLNEGKDVEKAYAAENIQNAITLDELLDALMGLYEID